MIPLEPDTCPTCGAEHEGMCPYEATMVCPICAEVDCICDLLEEFPLGPPEYDFEEYDSAGAL